VANAFIAASTVHAASGMWYACPHCKEHHGVRRELLVPMTPNYMRAIVSGDPWGMMLLSFLDSPITLSSWANSFTHGRATGHLWDSPFIHFTRDVGGVLTTTLDHYVRRVLDVNLRHNLYYKSLSCLLQVGFASYGHPCVDLNFFGPETLSTMHRAEPLDDMGAFVAAVDADEFGVLNSSSVFTYQKHQLFEVRGVRQG
jgi:hypothetical protein